MTVSKFLLSVVRNGISVEDENFSVLNTSILLTLVKYENVTENKCIDTSI